MVAISIDRLYRRWWLPADLMATCDQIRLSPCVDLDEFRHDNAMKPVREAKVAAKFASTRPCDLDWKIWIVPQADGFPDFKLCHDQDERLFEVVEARYPRHAEDKDEFQGWRHEDPDEHFCAGLHEAVEKIRQKAAKNYHPRPHLLVYCNFYGGKVPLDAVRAKIGDEYRDKFRSIWLLWDGDVKPTRL